MLEEYVWIVVLGFIMAFWDSFGIGANDVANSFATSVSSRSLTLKQAVIIACFTEFGGAALLGGSTTSAIKGVVRGSYFEDRPELLMLVMLSSLFGSSIWVIFASSRGWPVSTTHATVGGLSGAAITAFGANALKWTLDEDKSVLEIVIAWLASPVMAGTVGAIIFTINKFFVLRSDDSFHRAGYAVAGWFGIAAFVSSQYLIAKAPGLKQLELPVWITLLISAGVLVLFFAWAMIFYVPWVRRVVENREDLRWWHIFYTPFVKQRPARSIDEKLEEAKDDLKGQEGEVGPAMATLGFVGKLKKKLLHGVEKDVVNHEGDQRVQDMHALAEKFDPKTEEFFSYLQVFTAMLNSFAHGSNDVANAIGPLATIWSVYNTGVFDSKVQTPIWILMYGGLGIDIGLLTYGYHVMRKLGNKITYQSPSRGFCTELSASLTVLTASFLALPVSTTHCLVGATTGVGLASNGSLKSVNWKVLAEAFLSWGVTVPAAGLVSAAVFGFGAYAPNVA